MCACVPYTFVRVVRAWQKCNSATWLNIGRKGNQWSGFFIFNIYG